MSDDFKSLINQQIQKQNEVLKGGEKATKNKVKKEVVKKEVETNPFKAENLPEFFKLIGYDVNLAQLEEGMKTLKKTTIYGETDLITYESLIKAKVYEYIKFGVAKRVWAMMEEQAERRHIGGKGLKETDLLLILLEMARMEVEYGLRPIIHVIPVDGQIYVKADGFLYYGKASGNLKNIKWEDVEKNGVWYSKCIVYTTSGEYEGIASAKPNPKVYTDDPREKARTKAMRRALRRAFPIGAGDEIYDEFENSPIKEINVSENLKELLGNIVENKDIEKETKEIAEDVIMNNEKEEKK